MVWMEFISSNEYYILRNQFLSTWMKTNSDLDRFVLVDIEKLILSEVCFWIGLSAITKLIGEEHKDVKTGGNCVRCVLGRYVGGYMLRRILTLQHELFGIGRRAITENRRRCVRRSNSVTFICALYDQVRTKWSGYYKKNFKKASWETTETETHFDLMVSCM